MLLDLTGVLELTVCNIPFSDFQRCSCKCKVYVKIEQHKERIINTSSTEGTGTGTYSLYSSNLHYYMRVTTYIITCKRCGKKWKSFNNDDTALKIVGEINDKNLYLRR